MRLGWWLLAVSATAGLALEFLHAFKASVYLDASNDTRRLMWTLAHAHGVGLALVNIAFAWTVKERGWSPRLPSTCLVAASVLLPSGFFLGGISFYSGDPGLGVLLVPVGAVLLIVAVVITARVVTGASS
jgi:hypothetical protein